MTYSGHIENGLVVFDAAPGLPDGTAVVVTVVEKSAPATEREIPTLYERLKPIIGIAEGLPEDASQNIDHYLYGHPKK
ncbi:MAG: hypothetical protein AB7L90_26145 [Hyphomicrobiaceae bacterium]